MLRSAECPYIVSIGMNFNTGNALLYQLTTPTDQRAASNRAHRRYYHPRGPMMRAKYAQVKKAYPGVFS